MEIRTGVPCKLFMLPDIGIGRLQVTGTRHFSLNLMWNIPLYSKPVYAVFLYFSERKQKIDDIKKNVRDAILVSISLYW